MSGQFSDVTVIPLAEGGYSEVGAVVAQDGAIRYYLSADSYLTKHDSAVIAGELLRRSHAPTLPSGSGDKT